MKTTPLLSHRVHMPILVISVILAALPVAAAEPPTGDGQMVYADTKAKIEFPATLAGCKYAGRKEYDEPGLGYSLSYRSTNVTYTLYVYNAGLTDIGEGRQGRRVEQLFNQARAELAKAREAGMYDEVEPLVLKTPPAAALTNRFLWASYRMRYSVKSGRSPQPLHSFLAVTGHQGFCVKTRCTALASADIAENWSQFHVELARLLEGKNPPSAPAKTPAAAPPAKP